MADIKEVERYKYLDQVFTPGKKTSDVKDIYDKWSATYDKDLHGVCFTQIHAARSLSESVTDKGARVLDCGCGTGLVGEELQKLGYHNIDGVDLSEKSLEIARKKAVYKYLTCAVLGPHRLEGVGENSYDAIVSSGCFVCDGHLNDSVLKEWTRIVKPGGYIVIAVNARYIGLCEGDTYKMLIADKRMELVKRQSIDRFTWDHKTQQYMSGFVYSLKVLA
ncbi:methyltransferase-like protein 27 isoform X1 [Ptychodera flava]|uniref:methyltransferase-like protein 27 isoform X1 n=1 Tax=Ptychodera flava TaxID=63121 RepID=UPI00396A3235